MSGTRSADLILWRHAEAHLPREGQADVFWGYGPNGELHAERRRQRQM